ncbi:MAG: hypothetical protein K1W19_00980 [Lachnospiraceae bacterium]
MFNKNHIPDLYRKMNKLGYLDYFSKHYIWMYEMEWMPYKEVMNYKYEEDMTKEVLPFAFTSGGDLWAFIENGTSHPHIGRYYHPEEDGEYCAKNFEDAILLDIIEFACSSSVLLNENGEAVSEIFSEQQIVCYLKEYYKVYQGLLCQEYLDIIEYLSNLHFKKCSFHSSHWLALLSDGEADVMINRYLNFPKMGQPVVWYSTDKDDF